MEQVIANLLDNVGKEKEVTEEKIVKEEKKIEGLEKLLADLTTARSKKKKKQLLVEPEKVKPVHEEVKQVILKKPEKLDLTKTKDYVAEKYVKPLEKEEIFLDEEARKVVANKYSELGHATLQSFLSPKEIESDPDIINKVESHIAEMKIANELEKDKISKLKSIDTLEKLTEEFLRFKNTTAVKLSTLGGGGSTRKLENDDVDISSIGNGKILEYNSTTGKMQFVSSGSEVTNLEVLGTIIFEGATADDFETTVSVVDPTADRTITLPNASGAIPVLAAASNTQITATPEELNHVDGVTGNIQTALDTKATKAFAIAQAVALG